MRSRVVGGNGRPHAVTRERREGVSRWKFAVPRRHLTGASVSFFVHVFGLLALALVVTPVTHSRSHVLALGRADAETIVDIDEPLMDIELVDLATAEVAVVEEPVSAVESVEETALDIATSDLPDLEVAEHVYADPLAGVVGMSDVFTRLPDIGADQGGGVGLGMAARGADAGEAEIGRRLARAGAKTGDIQVSLAWNNINDIDLHVIAPSGERIFFGHRASFCRGFLDVDMNVAPQTMEPVENVFWPPGGAPRGVYQVYVHHFSNHGARDPTPFRIRILVGGRKTLLEGAVSIGQPPVLVAEFRHDGEGLPFESDAAVRLGAK